MSEAAEYSDSFDSPTASLSRKPADAGTESAEVSPQKAASSRAASRSRSASMSRSRSASPSEDRNVEAAPATPDQVTAPNQDVRKDAEDEEADEAALAEAPVNAPGGGGTQSKELDVSALPPQPVLEAAALSRSSSRGSRSHRSPSRSQTRSRSGSRPVSRSRSASNKSRSRSHSSSGRASEHMEDRGHTVTLDAEHLDATEDRTRHSHASSSIRTGSSRSSASQSRTNSRHSANIQSSQVHAKEDSKPAPSSPQADDANVVADAPAHTSGRGVLVVTAAPPAHHKQHVSKKQPAKAAKTSATISPPATTRTRRPRDASTIRKRREEQPLSQEEIQEIRDQVEQADRSSPRKARAIEQQRLLQQTIQNFYRKKATGASSQDSRSKVSIKRDRSNSLSKGYSSADYLPLPFIATSASIQHQQHIESQVLEAATLGRGQSPGGGSVVGIPALRVHAGGALRSAGRVGSVTQALTQGLLPHKPPSSATPTSGRQSPQTISASTFNKSITPYSAKMALGSGTSNYADTIQPTALLSPHPPPRSPYLSQAVPYTTYDQLYQVESRPLSAAIPTSRLTVPKAGNSVTGKGNWRTGGEERTATAPLQQHGSNGQYVGKSSSGNPHSAYGRFGANGAHFSRRGYHKVEAFKVGPSPTPPLGGSWSPGYSHNAANKPNDVNTNLDQSMSRTLAADVDIWTLECSLLTLTYAKVLSRSEDYARRQLRELQSTKMQQLKAIYTEANAYMRGRAARLTGLSNEEETGREGIAAIEVDAWGRLEAAAAANAKTARSQEEVFPQCVTLSEGQKHIIENSHQGSFVLDLRWTGGAGDAVVVTVVMYTADNRLCFTASGDEMLRCPKSGLPILRSWGEFRFNGKNNAAGKRMSIEFLLHNLAPSVGVRKIFVALLPPAKNGSSLKYLRRAYATIRTPSDGKAVSKLQPESRVDERCAIAIGSSKIESAGLVVASLIAGPPVARSGVDPSLITTLQQQMGKHASQNAGGAPGHKQTTPQPHATSDNCDGHHDDSNKSSRHSTRSNSPAASQHSSTSHATTPSVTASNAGDPARSAAVVARAAMAAEVAFSDTTTSLPWAMVNVLKPLDGIVSQRLLPKRIESAMLMTEPVFTLQYNADLNRILTQNCEFFERFWREVIAELTQATERDALMQAFEKGSEQIKMAALKRLRAEEESSNAFGVRRASHYPQRSVSLSGAASPDRRVSTQRRI